MPRLSIIVPVFNEEATLAAVMEAVLTALPKAQVIYVDDGSSDRSLAILRDRARPQDRVITKPNGGKGSAVREGLKHAEGDYCAIQDADLEYDPAELARLLDYAESQSGTIVFGSRFLQPNPNIYRLHLLGNKALTAFLNRLFRASLTDSYTCYKLFPTEVLQGLPLRARGFELEAELACYPLRRGLRIVELPISYQPRTFAEGKKIGWRDALRGVLTMLRIRFGG